MTRETLTLSAAECRFAADDTGTFTGYASVFGETDRYGDTIRPGAFKKTLTSRKNRGPVAFFWNHDQGKPIGVWTEIVEDQRGLKVTGKIITDTTAGRDAYLLLKAGAVTGLSIGFNPLRVERGPNGGRIVTEIDLVEISLVTLPAASKARVTSVKGADLFGVAAFRKAARGAALSFQWSKPR